MGGCVSSNGDVNDRHPNMFHVWNVDELGNVFIPGRIEVTETELVLYQKGKEPIRWPMRCLRRYGFDAELFSFESGRRCATGTGIYAFKCQRAEALFNLLQEQIQNSGQDSNQTDGGSSIGGVFGMNNHSGVGNGIVVATAAAANGSILRSGSLSVSDTGGNYLEPIVRYRTRSINNNVTTTNSRDGFSRMATQSLPSNIAFIDNGAVSATPHYVNEDVVTSTSTSSINNGTCCVGDTVNVRSPLMTPPPTVLPSLHEYANATIMMTDSGLPNEPSAATRPKSLQECHQSSTTSASDKKTPEDVSSVLPVTSSSIPKNTALYSILDLPKNMLAGATGAVRASNGCRQVVLRGHSLDETTNYARLDDLLKQEHTSAQRHLYMNVVPDSVQKSGATAVAKDGSITVQSSNVNIQHQSSQKHHHRHHNHPHNNHQHHAGAGFYGRQKSVESPLMFGSGVSSACGITSASGTVTAKDCVVNNNNNNNNNSHQHHHHYHHHSNSISYHPSPTSTTTTVVSRQVNYAVLDLNHRGSSSSGGSISMGVNGDCIGVVSSRSDTAPTSPVSLATPPEPLQQQPQPQQLLLNPPANCRTALEGYATIDFDRTVALSNVSAAHPCLDNDESVRKTRHNSTINDLFLSKHSSIVSE